MSVNEKKLADYYQNACWEYGYASLCHMTPPADLEGKTVVDIGCRRGKGVFKFSERVGAQGHVIGVDWVKDHIDEANARSGHAARKTGLPANNMEFHVAYPEDLTAAGLENASADVVFINSILHLTCEPAVALSEMHRILKPGGLLVLEVVLANRPRNPDVVSAARALGNSIQAAPSRSEFEEQLDSLGFDVEIAAEPHAVEPSMGYKKDFTVPVAPSDETIAFEAFVLHATKR